MKKYLLMGGYIISKSDGDRHFISANQLRNLYKLDPEECYFADQTRPETFECFQREELTELYPRYDGNYDLSPRPKEKNAKN